MHYKLKTHEILEFIHGKFMGILKKFNGIFMGK